VKSHLRTIAKLALLIGISVSAARAQGFQIPDDARDAVRTRVDNGYSVGIVLGVVDGSGTRYFSYGSTAKTGGQPVNERTVYEIGSITKVFTAVTLADMAVKGEVGLDDPVQRYLPDSVHVPSRSGKEITLRLISAQRSGLPRMPGNFVPADMRNPYIGYDPAHLYAFLNDYTLPRDPGASYEYSNLAVSLLGFALARRSRTTYEDLVLRRVIGPLHLADTRVTLTGDLRARLAHGHAGEQEVPNWDFDPYLGGAGALRSTAADLATFLAAAMGLTHTPLDSAFKLTEEIQYDAGPNMRIGLGWHVIGPDSSKIYWHNGGTGGYHTFIAFDPRRKIGVIALSNSTQGDDDIGFHMLSPTMPMENVRVAIAMPADSLDSYVGTYLLAPTFALTVRKEGAGLVAQATGQGPNAIYPSARDEFFYKVVDAQISFVRDSTGKVASLVLHQGGRNMPAPKAP
jgi:serine-type D-Ala-D-Ala carboxypeptidase/endopeptidase